MPSCGLIRCTWGCGGSDWAGVVVSATFVALLLSRGLIWSLIAGSVYRGGAGVGADVVSWMIGHCSGMSMRMGVS